ncbi:hypothetical protein D3C73_1517010 [compost metagenome]
MRLAGVWKSLTDNMAKREDYFNFGKVYTVTNTEAEFKQTQSAAAKKGKKDGGDGEAEQSELPLD